MYKIRYFYETGDSFGRRDEEDVLEMEWNDIEVVKECIRRIREHYEWYTYKHNRYWGDEKEKPSWHNVTGRDSFVSDACINLPLDNGREVQFYAPWCGYFERLYGARIELKGEDAEFDTDYPRF